MYITTDTNSTQDHTDVGNESDDLTTKSKDQLIEEVRHLRQEINNLGTNKSILEKLYQNICKKRDAVVSVLNWIDELTAAVNTAGVTLTAEVECQSTPSDNTQVDVEYTPTASTSHEDVVPPHTSGNKATTVNPPQHQQGRRPDIRQDNQTLRQQRPPDNLIQSPTNHQAKKHLTQYHQTQIHSGTKIHNHRDNRTQYRQDNRPPNRPVNQTQNQPDHRIHKQHGHITGNQQYTRPNNRPARQTNNQHFHQTQPPHSNTCRVCSRRGHTEENCRTRYKCEYCGRIGHTADVCRSRSTDEKQERMLRTLVAEQANHTACILRSIQGSLVSAPVLREAVHGFGVAGAGQQPYPPQQQHSFSTQHQLYHPGQHGGQLA